MKMATKWDSQTTIKFINEYKSHECLWNFSSSKYKNKRMRDTAYRQIATSMNIADFGVQEVKNKIKNLRSTYSQEMKKIEDAKKAGDLYESNLKWLTTLEPVFIDGQKRKQSDMDKNLPILTDSFLGSKRDDSNDILFQELSCSSPDLKRRFKQLHAEASLTLTSDLHEDEFDVFGRSVAMQLKKLSPERALFAQCRIQNLLSELGIEELRETSISSICIDPISIAAASYTDIDVN